MAEILGTIEKRATGQVVSSLTQSSFSAAAAAKGSDMESTMTKSILGDSGKKKAPTS